MKDFQQFKSDLLMDEELKMALKKTLGRDDITLPAENVDTICAFAAAHGYEFTVEDVHFETAARRDLSEEELQLVTAGGYADLINFGSCEQDYGCYNDFGCALTQHIKRSGFWSPGVCLASYGCSMILYTCASSNDCYMGQVCHTETI